MKGCVSEKITEEATAMWFVFSALSHVNSNLPPPSSLPLMSRCFLLGQVTCAAFRINAASRVLLQSLPLETTDIFQNTVGIRLLTSFEEITDDEIPMQLKCTKSCILPRQLVFILLQSIGTLFKFLAILIRFSE